MLTALRIGLGVWVGYTLLGVGVLMRQSAWLFGAATLAGAAYLIYLGWKMLRSPPGDLAATAARPVSGLGALRTGFLTNALNPKTTVFIVSLFMQVVDPQTPLGVQLAYGAFISLAHAVWFSLVALGRSAQAVRQRLLDWRRTIDGAFGGALMGLGVWLAAARART